MLVIVDDRDKRYLIMDEPRHVIPVNNAVHWQDHVKSALVTHVPPFMQGKLMHGTKTEPA